MPILKHPRKGKRKIQQERKPPERPFAGMKIRKLGVLFPETPFYFSPGGQFLSGVILYHSIGSSYCRVRVQRPNGQEVIEDISLSSGSIVLVKETDYEGKQKEKTAEDSRIHHQSGLEGFPEK